MNEGALNLCFQLRVEKFLYLIGENVFISSHVLVSILEFK